MAYFKMITPITRNQVVYSQCLTFFVTYKLVKQARLFVHDKPF
jgi:hypothetical protein